MTQNGGLDLASSGLPQLRALPPASPAPPSLQRVLPDGTVEIMTKGLEVGGLRAPNDLCVTADGTVVFTDPGHFPPPDPRVARLLAYHRGGTVEVVADGFTFCNGVAAEAHGSLVVVEGRGLQRIGDDGSREWVIRNLGEAAGDGFCLDADGRFYVACTMEHGVKVVEPDGRIVDMLHIPGEGLTTNCCFGGAGGRTLFATDALPGRVVAREGLPTPGLPMQASAAP